jgi:hypothetical protein
VAQIATAALDLDKLVDAAGEARRDELLKLIRQRVEDAVDTFVADVLAAEIAERERCRKSCKAWRGAATCGSEGERYGYGHAGCEAVLGLRRDEAARRVLQGREDERRSSLQVQDVRRRARARATSQTTGGAGCRPFRWRAVDALALGHPRRRVRQIVASDIKQGRIESDGNGHVRLVARALPADPVRALARSQGCSRSVRQRGR